MSWSVDRGDLNGLVDRRDLNRMDENDDDVITEQEFEAYRDSLDEHEIEAFNDIVHSREGGDGDQQGRQMSKDDIKEFLKREFDGMHRKDVYAFAKYLIQNSGGNGVQDESEIVEILGFDPRTMGDERDRVAAIKFYLLNMANGSHTIGDSAADKLAVELESDGYLRGNKNVSGKSVSELREAVAVDNNDLGGETGMDREDIEDWLGMLFPKMSKQDRKVIAEEIMSHAGDDGAAGIKDGNEIIDHILKFDPTTMSSSDTRTEMIKYYLDNVLDGDDRKLLSDEDIEFLAVTLANMDDGYFSDKGNSISDASLTDLLTTYFIQIEGLSDKSAGEAAEYIVWVAEASDDKLNLNGVSPTDLGKALLVDSNEDGLFSQGEISAYLYNTYDAISKEDADFLAAYMISENGGDPYAFDELNNFQSALGTNFRESGSDAWLKDIFKNYLIKEKGYEEQDAVYMADQLVNFRDGKHLHGTALHAYVNNDYLLSTNDFMNDLLGREVIDANKDGVFTQPEIKAWLVSQGIEPNKADAVAQYAVDQFSDGVAKNGTDIIKSGKDLARVLGLFNMYEIHAEYGHFDEAQLDQFNEFARDNSLLRAYGLYNGGDFGAFNTRQEQMDYVENWIMGQIQQFKRTLDALLADVKR